MGFEYTVNGKDKGLSHIFLEAAKKKGGFNFAKKIDWNKVMSVFAQVQKEEQANQGTASSDSASSSNTEVGSIATMLEDTDSLDTPLKRKLNKVGEVLSIIGILVAILIFIIGLIYGKDFISLLMVSIAS